MLNMRCLVLALFVFSGNILFAQSISHKVISSGGNSSINDGYYVSATISEVMVTTLSAGNYFLSQGFQQPSIYVGNPEYENITSFDTYPNPVKDKLNIEFIGENLADYIVDIFSLTGVKIGTYKLSKLKSSIDIITIDFSEFPKGFYMIRIYSPNSEIIRIYKIEKI